MIAECGWANSPLPIWVVCVIGPDGSISTGRHCLLKGPLLCQATRSNIPTQRWWSSHKLCFAQYKVNKAFRLNWILKNICWLFAWSSLTCLCLASFRGLIVFNVNVLGRLPWMMRNFNEIGASLYNLCFDHCTPMVAGWGWVMNELASRTWATRANWYCHSLSTWTTFVVCIGHSQLEKPCSVEL